MGWCRLLHSVYHHCSVHFHNKKCPIIWNIRYVTCGFIHKLNGIEKLHKISIDIIIKGNVNNKVCLSADHVASDSSMLIKLPTDLNHHAHFMFKYVILYPSAIHSWRNAFHVMWYSLSSLFENSHTGGCIGWPQQVILYFWKKTPRQLQKLIYWAFATKVNFKYM